MSDRRRQARTAVTAAAAGAAAAVAALRSQGERRAPGADQVAVKEVHIVAHGGVALRVRRHRPADGDVPAARVVFAHGWGMGLEFWDDAARRLAALGMETVTYDQRGHGRSETPRSLDECTIDALGHDLRAILAATTAPPAPTLLVAHSMGGMTVLRWAGIEAADPQTDAPTPVGALLWNTAYHDFIPDTLAALTRSTDPRMHRLANVALHTTVAIPGGRAALPVVRRLGHGPAATRRGVALTHRLLRGLDPEVRVRFAAEFEQLDLRGDLEALTIPTTVVNATGDLITPPGHGARLAELLPDGELLSLPGAGHQAPLDHPDLVIDLVLQRLRGLLALPQDHPIVQTPLQARRSWSVIDGGTADDDATGDLDAEIA